LCFVQSPDYGKILKCSFQFRFQKVAPYLKRHFLLFIEVEPATGRLYVLMTGSLTRLRTTLKTTLSSFVVDILDARENLQSRLAPVRDGLSGTDFHFWLGSRSRSFIAPMASEGYLDETPNSSGSIILATRHRIEGSSSFSPPPHKPHSRCLPFHLARRDRLLPLF
jgi:hypothetical protein